MVVEPGPNGLVIASGDGCVDIGPGLPELTIRVNDGRDGRAIDWQATRLDQRDGDWVADVAGTAGVSVEIDGTGLRDGRIAARVVNDGAATVHLDRLTLFRSSRVVVGKDPKAWRIYRNGYQSWAGTWTIGVDECDRDVPTRLGRMGVTDGRHRAATGRGHVRSDTFSALVEPVSRDAVAIGFTTLADAFGFVELDAPGGDVRSLSVWVDLDDTELPTGEATPWFEVAVAMDASGTTALRTVIDAAGNAMGARTGDGHHPAGWCSWYYYFTKVTEADIDTNLGVLAADGVRGPKYGCEYVMVDDGHQQAIGDWLDTNGKFPSGMEAVASRIREAGFDAGLWWAPFIVSAKSQIAAEHPDWLVRTRRGRPMVGLVNPGWGLVPMWVLDTTHPVVLDHIREVARVIGHDWGYRIQKIDFLFAASAPGVRHDRSATRAEALRRGIAAVRDGAGTEGFVLGCGSPMGPAVGLVDAMRIGADVTPSWTTLIARTAGRDRHALATANSLLNTLTRSMLDGAWFLNDPDCLMVRDTDTKLTEEEVQLMCTVFGMTDGMLVLSDRMDRLPPHRQDLVARTRGLTGGRAEVVDLFERALPRLLVSRHADRIDVAAVNLDNRSRVDTIDLAAVGLTAADVEGLTPRDYWTGAAVRIDRGRIEFGVVAPHSAKVVQIPRS